MRMCAPFGPTNSVPHLDPHTLAWCEIDAKLIFLDIANDRYFQLAEDENRSMLKEIRRSGFDSWHQPSWLPRPSGFRQARKSSDAMDTVSFNLAEVARAMWVQRRTERRLASKGFASTLRHLSKALGARPLRIPASDDAARLTISAFSQSRLIRTAANRCLSRSIALALCLAGRGVRAQVIIGVRCEPFGAHCWVQAGDEVLNESVEETMRYQPILAI